MHRKSLTTTALVLKRVSTGEADRVITLLTETQGKVVCIAKGVRSFKSTKRAYLEPGSHIKCSLILTKSMPIMTQATLLEDTHLISGNLAKIRQLLQVLEMIDVLFVEEIDDRDIFEHILKIREKIICAEPTSGAVLRDLEELIQMLGYQALSETNYTSLTEYVSFLSDRKLRTWEYLKT